MNSFNFPPPSGEPEETVWPRSEQERVGTRSFTLTWAFATFLGLLGVDQFYLGKIGWGLLKLFTLGGFLILYVLDLVNLFGRRMRDGAGLALSGYPEKMIGFIIGSALVFVFILSSLSSFGDGVSSAETSAETSAEASAEASSCASTLASYGARGDREIVSWALDKVVAGAPSPDLWCDVSIEAFHAKGSDQRVSFEVWTTLDPKSSESYKKAYEFCRVFMEPFEKVGVSIKIRSEVTEVEVTLDERENFNTRNSVIMSGMFGEDQFFGGCNGRVYFPKVVPELESDGWRGGSTGDKTFSSSHLSERDDYYCTRQCS